MPRIRSNAADLAVAEILKKITLHELVTGDIVSDMELSNQLEMSRTPIREGIITLIEAGVLERTRTKVVVKAITMEDVIEILDVRDAIERKTIEIIFEKGIITDEMIDVLQAIEDDLDKNILNGNFDANFNADKLFHQELIAFSGNKRFENIYNRLSLQFSRLRWLTTLTPARYSQTKSEHQDIINALRNRSMEETINATRNHIIKSKENYQEILLNPYWNNIADEIKRMQNK